MTRINVIDVKFLTDQHLFAEYREITRLFALVKQSCDKYPVDTVLKKVVPTYRLGAGHVLFFYDKLAYIEKRYLQLKDEVLLRGFNVTLKDNIIEFRKLIDERFYRDFSPDVSDMAINIERLIEKINDRPNWYRLAGVVIDDDYIKKLQKLTH